MCILSKLLSFFGFKKSTEDTKELVEETRVVSTEESGVTKVEEPEVELGDSESNQTAAEEVESNVDETPAVNGNNWYNPPVEILDEVISNGYIAFRLKIAMELNQIKRYHNITKFIQKWGIKDYDYTSVSLHDITVSSAVEKLKNKFKVLGYKCKDKELEDFFKN